VPEQRAELDDSESEGAWPSASHRAPGWAGPQRGQRRWTWSWSDGASRPAPDVPVRLAPELISLRGGASRREHTAHGGPSAAPQGGAPSATTRAGIVSGVRGGALEEIRFGHGTVKQFVCTGSVPYEQERKALEQGWRRFIAICRNCNKNKGVRL
jgi:hypothetical protein